MVAMFLFASIVFALIFAVLYQQVVSRRINGRTWNQLIATIAPVEMSDIALLALDWQNPGHSELRVPPKDKWRLIGRVEGLKRLSTNADLLIALAAHAESWDVVEGTAIAERMRREGLSLRHTISLIYLTMSLNFGSEWASSYISIAACKYLTMTTQVIELYTEGPRERLEVLDAVVWRHELITLV